MASPLSNLIWSVADLLRGDYKQADYGKVILPFTLLRRLDCVLEPTKAAVLAEAKAKKGEGELVLDRALCKASKQTFYNTSQHTLNTMLSDPDQLKQNLLHYLSSFSTNAQDVFTRYKFAEQVEFLAAKNLLYLVLQSFTSIDLRPSAVSNADMGLVFEELIRKFAELSNETAGEHFTPREVIRLMVNLLFCEDGEALTKPGVIRTLYDCCAGTGGMLSVSEEHLRSMNPKATLKVFGQELNEESYAICKADMLIKGADVKNIIQGNTLSEDGLPDKKFDYMLTNPPFGVEWKKVQKEVEKEAEHGFAGRFGPGLPRISDGSLLFLLHLLSKMRPVDEGGSRIGIVLNGSPLFTGGAGSGESEIRKYILENDFLEAIVALPTDMFYNTGIATYVWILTNHKAPARKGKVQLINGIDLWKKMKKSLGSKRKELGEEHIELLTKTFGNFKETDICRIVPNVEFGYSTITVERPLRNEKGAIETDRKGNPKPDSSLRDTENVPLSDDIEAYFKREVLPHVPDAWIDHAKTKVGYEIPFTRYFYTYKPPRPLEEIDRDLKAKTEKIMKLLGEISG
ncbi:MAG TPA: class I SAM-dependent DNA methyltransferase [Spirochaetales bacterium]|nr:class I SAM-dependent DNA methyltransferase [Spirochaetales bacterium]